MKRFFTALPLLFTLCVSTAILFAFQGTDPFAPDGTTTTIVAHSLEDEVKRLSDQLRLFEASLQDQERELIPPGTIAAYMGKIDKDTPPPKGWLLCDGQTPLDKPEYVDLKKVIGIDSVPDYRGYFLRGLDPTAKVDPEGTVRTLTSPPQRDTFASHRHTGETSKIDPHNHKPEIIDSFDDKPKKLLKYGLIRQITKPEGGTPNGWDGSRNELEITKVHPIPSDGEHGHKIMAEGEKETRPKNVAINWIIKY